MQLGERRGDLGERERRVVRERRLALAGELEVHAVAELVGERAHVVELAR